MHIEKEAFMGCWKMESIVIPDSVCNISETAFSVYDRYLKRKMGCNENLTLKASKGSYGEEYAKRNKYKFITVEDK